MFATFFDPTPVTRSPVRTPALAAGLPGSTRATTGPPGGSHVSASPSPHNVLPSGGALSRRATKSATPSGLSSRSRTMSGVLWSGA